MDYSKPELKPGMAGSEKIQFKPLSEGLGFHTFPDGFPYISQKPSQRLGQSREDGKIGRLSEKGKSPFPHHPVPLSQEIKKTQTKSKTQVFGPKLGLGYLIKRLLAYAIDSMVTVMILVIFAWNQMESLQSEVFRNSGVVLVAAIVATWVQWAQVLVQEILFKTSIGKWFLDLSFQGTRWAIFLRAVFFIPSVGLFGIGLLWSLMDRGRQCWHDKIANLQPL